MMTPINIAKILVMPALGAILFSGSAAAQTAEQCNQNVAEICGDMDTTQCFDKDANWSKIISGCESDVQTQIEMAREAMEQMKLEGASLGGKVRSGPSTNDSQIGSLAEGDEVLLERNTGVMFNGYPWFEISRYDEKTGKSIFGYQWGGILCSFHGLEGVYNKCPTEWSKYYVPANMEKSSNGVGQDPIAPAHGNSDEDNAEQDVTIITQCLSKQKAADYDGLTCVGAISDDCLADENNQSTFGMQQCIGYEKTAWDTILNTEYKELMAVQDSDDKKAALRDAQRLWIAFAGPFCKLSYTLNGGTFAAITGAQCITDLTAQQVVQLQNLNIGEN